MLEGPALTPPNPKYAVILLHGYGADGQNLLDLAYFFEKFLPMDIFGDIAWFAPNAPDPTPYNEGYQWFDIEEGRFADKPGLEASRDEIDQLVEHIRQEYGIEKYILLGFSQGGMTSLFSAPHLQTTPTGVISYAGMLLFEDKYPQQPAHIPHLLLHGEADPVVEPEGIESAKAELEQRGQAVTAHTFPDVEHFIAPEAMPLMAEFIETHLT